MSLVQPAHFWYFAIDLEEPLCCTETDLFRRQSFRFFSGDLAGLFSRVGQKFHATYPNCQIEQASPSHILMCFYGTSHFGVVPK